MSKVFLGERRKNIVIELFTTYGISTVVLILLIAIPALFNFVKWCKGLYA
jgi:hypothetical protein